MKTTPSKHALLRSPFGGRGALLLLLLPLWGLGGFSYAQTVTLIGEDFDKSEVKFSVTLSSSTPTWVFVEYTHPPTHDPAFMSRATFTSVTFTPSGAGTLIDDSSVKRRGFRLESSATVTAKLEGVSGMFSWCAYAISAPPNAVPNPDGDYTLRGTPPFTVNGVELAESASTFGPACITSITDFTYNPDGFFPPPPEVTVTASETTVCAGAEVTFTATATGGTTTAMTYTWVIAGNTYTSTENTYPHALSTPGDATYTVRVTNANGCTSTVSPAGTVTVNALPAVTAVSSSTVCYGTPATLTAEVSGTTTPTYTWKINGETTTTNMNTYPMAALTTTTTYTVQITNDDSGCTSAVSAVGTITVSSMPKFESAPTAPVCPNTEVTFTASGAGDGGLYCFTYECSECIRNPFLTGQEVPAAAHCLWDSDCEFGTAETYSVMMPDAGSMTVWVQAIDQYGCTNTASTVVEIIAVPTVFKVNSPTICYDATAALSATVSNAPSTATYTWDIDGYSTTTTPTNTYTTPALTATVNYTVQISNDTGCTSTVSAAGSIRVLEPFDAGSISSDTQTICKDAAVPTIGNAQGPSGGGGDGNYTYRWRHNGTEEFNENTATFQPTAYQSTPGTHTFTREVYPGCEPGAWVQSGNTWTLVVLDLPATPVDPSSVVICAGNTATFSASAGDGETIDWYGAPTGGSALSANTWSYTPASPLTANTSYYAEARNTATGCVSAERLQVTTTVNVVPTVTAVSASICYNTPATLTANATNETPSATYTWMIQNVGSPQTTTVGVCTTTALTANLTYTVQITNDTGCTSTVSNTGTITVYDEFFPGTITKSAETICSGDVVTTVADPASGGNSSFVYQWQHNGVDITGAIGATYTPSGSYNTDLGPHTFTRRAKDGQCSDFIQSAGSYVLTVIEVPLKPADPSSVAICPGNTATFSASAGDGETIDWYTALTGGNRVLENSWSYTPEAPLTATTSYYAAAKIIATGCVSAERLQVTTTVYVVPVVTAVSASVCYDTPATLTANATNATPSATYTWEINGESATTNTNTYTIPAGTAPVTYTVQITNDTGCTSTVSNAGTITWYDEFFPGTITKSAETICSSDVVVTEADPATGGHESLITYQWQHNGVDITGATGQAYTPSGSYNTEAGAHTFTRLAKDGQCSGFIPSAGSYVLTVNPRPLTPVSASSVVICAGLTATFSASLSESDGVTIDWYDTPTGGNCVLENSWSYTPDSPLTITTSYYAAARIIETGCLSIPRLQVTTTVNPLPDIRVDGVPGSACVGDELNVQASGAFAGGSYCFNAYVDDVGNSDCEYDEANTFTVTVPNEGTMMIKVRAITALGCVDSVLVHLPDMGSSDCINGAGTILSNSVTAILGPYPPRTATNKPTTVEPAANQNATYEWRRTGTSSAILANSNTDTYILTKDDDALYTAGTYYYSRWAFYDSPKNSVGLRADGTYTLVVVAPPTSGAGTTTWKKENSNVIWSGAVRINSCDPTRPASPAGYTYVGSCLYDNRTQFCNGKWSAPSTSPCGAIDLEWLRNTSVGEGGWNNANMMYQWGSAEFWVPQEHRERCGCNDCANGVYQYNWSYGRVTTSACTTYASTCSRNRKAIRCVANYNY